MINILSWTWIKRHTHRYSTVTHISGVRWFSLLIAIACHFKYFFPNVRAGSLTIPFRNFVQWYKLKRTSKCMYSLQSCQKQSLNCVRLFKLEKHTRACTHNMHRHFNLVHRNFTAPLSNAQEMRIFSSTAHSIIVIRTHDKQQISAFR